jgi:hypothetical protein
MNYTSHHDEQLLKKWAGRYGIPPEMLNQVDFLTADFFVGGYPEFLQVFAKLK